jgi:hypothetical protein
MLHAVSVTKLKLKTGSKQKQAVQDAHGATAMSGLRENFITCYDLRKIRKVCEEKTYREGNGKLNMGW